MDSPSLQPVSANPAAPPAPPSFALNERLTQRGLAFLAFMFVALLVHRGYDLQFRTRPTEAAPPTAAKLDLNATPVDELQLLPGIGPRLAGAIEDRRKTQGPFRTIDELRTVPGIGPATFDKLSPFLTVAPTVSSVAAAEPLVLSRKTPTTPAPSTSTLININTANAEELGKLPGIGTKLAQRIIEHRTATPFARVEDIAKVHGIGMGKTYEKIRPLISVE